MLKSKISMLLLFFFFLCHTIECKELRSDIQLLVACGFIKEAKLELIAVARDPMSSQQDRVQALLLLNTMASNNIERKVVLARKIHKKGSFPIQAIVLY